MADIASGTITLDGVLLTAIPRPLVRKRLSCITQEPFIFTNTVRLNADPLEENSDASIRAALERVGLWRVIAGKTNPDGGNGIDPLDTRLDENFLSHGQRQLFCLARALLKKSLVLILDEPTSRYDRKDLSPNLLAAAVWLTNYLSSVDSKTDAEMQTIIRSEFKHCTIIMVAHRLDSLLDFDSVAVLDKGQLVEVGNPRALLGSPQSAFSRMYHAGSTAELEI